MKDGRDWDPEGPPGQDEAWLARESEPLFYFQSTPPLDYRIMRMVWEGFKQGWFNGANTVLNQILMPHDQTVPWKDGKELSVEEWKRAMAYRYRDIELVPRTIDTPEGWDARMQWWAVHARFTDGSMVMIEKVRDEDGPEKPCPGS